MDPEDQTQIFSLSGLSFYPLNNLTSSRTQGFIFLQTHLIYPLIMELGVSSKTKLSKIQDLVSHSQQSHFKQLSGEAASAALLDRAWGVVPECSVRHRGLPSGSVLWIHGRPFGRCNPSNQSSLQV